VGTIDEISKLNLTLQFFLMAAIITGSFFYIDLYFLKQPWFDKAQFYIPIVLSFVMSFAWYVCNTLFVVVVMQSNETEISSVNVAVLFSCVITIVAISAISIYWKISFRHFCLFCFWVYFGLMVLSNLFKKSIRKIAQ